MWAYLTASEVEGKATQIVDHCVYTECLFFIVNVTEREFLFLILVGETFFFCLMTSGDFCHSNLFFFTMTWKRLREVC